MDQLINIKFGFNLDNYCLISYSLTDFINFTFEQDIGVRQ